MTAPLDEKSEITVGMRVEKFTGEARWFGVVVSEYQTTRGMRRFVVDVEPQGFQMIAVPSQLRPALSAVALPDELEARLKPNAVVDHVPGLAVSNLRRVGSDDLAERLSHWIVQNNALKAEAHSTIAALRVEASHWLNEARRTLRDGQDALDRAETAEAEVKRLTEEKEAAHGQLTIAERDRDFNETCRASWQRRAEAAEARIKALEEALRPFANKPDDWTVDQVNAARAVLNSREKGE